MVDVKHWIALEAVNEDITLREDFEAFRTTIDRLRLSYRTQREMSGVLKQDKKNGDQHVDEIRLRNHLLMIMFVTSCEV